MTYFFNFHVSWLKPGHCRNGIGYGSEGRSLLKSPIQVKQLLSAKFILCLTSAQTLQEFRANLKQVFSGIFICKVDAGNHCSSFLAFIQVATAIACSTDDTLEGRSFEHPRPSVNIQQYFTHCPSSNFANEFPKAALPDYDDPGVGNVWLHHRMLYLRRWLGRSSSQHDGSAPVEQRPTMGSQLLPSPLHLWNGQRLPSLVPFTIVNDLRTAERCWQKRDLLIHTKATESISLILWGLVGICMAAKC